MSDHHVHSHKIRFSLWTHILDTDRKQPIMDQSLMGPFITCLLSHSRLNLILFYIRPHFFTRLVSVDTENKKKSSFFNPFIKVHVAFYWLLPGPLPSTHIRFSFRYCFSSVSQSQTDNAAVNSITLSLHVKKWMSEQLLVQTRIHLWEGELVPLKNESHEGKLDLLKMDPESPVVVLAVTKPMSRRPLSISWLMFIVSPIARPNSICPFSWNDLCGITCGVEKKHIW